MEDDPLAPTPSVAEEWAFWGRNPEDELFEHVLAIKSPKVQMSPKKTTRSPLHATIAPRRAVGVTVAPLCVRRSWRGVACPRV